MNAPLEEASLMTRERMFHMVLAVERRVLIGRGSAERDFKVKGGRRRRA